MKKNGFSFIETVVTVVILSTSLLLVYNSYSSIINNEQQRVYYNDPAYIYRTSTVMQFLNYNTKIIDVIKGEFAQADKYVQQVGINYNKLFENNNQKTGVEHLTNSLNINQMFIIKKELLEECHFNDSDSETCKKSIDELGVSSAKFVRTLSTDDDALYYLVVEYSEMSRFLGSEKGRLTKCYIATEQKYGCHYYYASIPVNGVYLL